MNSTALAAFGNNLTDPQKDSFLKTLKDISYDNANGVSMINDHGLALKIAVDFDAIKGGFCNTLNCPPQRSADALYLVPKTPGQNAKLYLIEFKNGSIDDSLIREVEEKMRDSGYMLSDTETMKRLSMKDTPGNAFVLDFFSPLAALGVPDDVHDFLRRHGCLMLVYNPDKEIYLPSKEKTSLVEDIERRCKTNSKCNFDEVDHWVSALEKWEPKQEKVEQDLTERIKRLNTRKDFQTFEEQMEDFCYIAENGFCLSFVKGFWEDLKSDLVLSTDFFNELCDCGLMKKNNEKMAESILRKNLSKGNFGLFLWDILCTGKRDCWDAVVTVIKKKIIAARLDSGAFPKPKDISQHIEDECKKPDGLNNLFHFTTNPNAQAAYNPYQSIDLDERAFGLTHLKGFLYKDVVALPKATFQNLMNEICRKCGD